MVNIVKDNEFRLGFKLKGLNSIRDGHNSIRAYPFEDSDPVWYLCQWNSKYNLIEQDFHCVGKAKVIADKSKTLTLTNDKLIFRLDANQEYEHLRLPSEGWPHLLIEQDITENNEIKNMTQLVLSASFKLNHLIDFMNGQKKEYHTAQFVWVVVLRNENQNSPDYHEFMWVVMGILDSRYEYVPLFCAQDKALPDGSFIYSFCGQDFLTQSLNHRCEVQVCFDLYPHMEKMLAVAKQNGYLLHTNKEDLILSSTNLGFEVTGTYDVEVEVRNLAILVN